MQGVEAIRQKVSELHLAGARVDLSDGSVDAQRSDINGVFVVVTGEFAQPSRSLEPKRFVQTFFLASQAPTGQAVSDNQRHAIASKTYLKLISFSCPHIRIGRHRWLRTLCATLSSAC